MLGSRGTLSAAVLSRSDLVWRRGVCQTKPCCVELTMSAGGEAWGWVGRDLREGEWKGRREGSQREKPSRVRQTWNLEPFKRRTPPLQLYADGNAVGGT